MTSDRPRPLIRRETFYPDAMSPNERAEFTARLFAAHSQIFAGISQDDFATHVVAPPARRTAIQLYYGARGDLVGYCGFHRFVRTIRGSKTMIIRAEAGFIPEYRGRAAAHWFGMLGALTEKLRHPFTPVFYFGTLVHPSSYRFFCKYFPKVFPRRDEAGQTDTLDLALEVADCFDDPPVSPDNRLVRQVGWVTIDPLSDPTRSARGANPDAAYFSAVNPGYGEGHGLVVLVPVTYANVGSAIGRRLREVALGMLRRRHVPV